MRHLSVNSARGQAELSFDSLCRTYTTLFFFFAWWRGAQTTSSQKWRKKYYRALLIIQLVKILRHCCILCSVCGFFGSVLTIVFWDSLSQVYMKYALYFNSNSVFIISHSLLLKRKHKCVQSFGTNSRSFHNP